MLSVDIVKVIIIRMIWSIRLAGVCKKFFKDTKDPFQSVPYAFPYQVLSSPRPFSTYLSKKNKVEVHSIEDIKNFLADHCLYRKDGVRFGCLDYWQMPDEFERNKEGDCEDSALWAWSNLIKLGFAAHFVSGLCIYHDKKYIMGHAWVIFESNGERLLFETASKSKEKMLIRYENARNVYVPMYSIDGLLKTYIYPGMDLLTKRPDFLEMKFKFQ